MNIMKIMIHLTRKLNVAMRRKRRVLSYYSCQVVLTFLDVDINQYYVELINRLSTIYTMYTIILVRMIEQQVSLYELIFQFFNTTFKHYIVICLSGLVALFIIFLTLQCNKFKKCSKLKMTNVKT